MNIYISSSWKNREAVRSMAISLRLVGHEVYDFTDPACRKTQEIPPEKYPESFDPEKHRYSEYISKPDWLNAVMENKSAIESSDLIVLLLPCGADSHADWAYGIGKGIPSVVVGQPRKGDRSPVHLWGNAIFDDVDQFLKWIERISSLAILATDISHDQLEQYRDAIREERFVVLPVAIGDMVEHENGTCYQVTGYTEGVCEPLTIVCVSISEGSEGETEEFEATEFGNTVFRAVEVVAKPAEKKL